MPLTAHGPEAGVRLCNTIRKMLERHEHITHHDRPQKECQSKDVQQFSRKEWPLDVHKSVAKVEHGQSKAAPIASSDRRPPHLHRKSKSVDLNLFNHGDSQFMMILPNDIVATSPTSSQVQDDEDYHVTLVNPPHPGSLIKQTNCDCEWSAIHASMPQSSLRDSIVTSEEHKATGPHMKKLPGFLRPNKPLLWRLRKLIQVTTDSVHYLVVDISLIRPGQHCRSFLSTQLGIENGNFYITAYSYGDCWRCSLANHYQCWRCQT